MPLPRSLGRFAFAAIAAAWVARPAQAIELTRTEVIDRALEHAYDITAAQRRREMTQARLDGSKALLPSNPYLSFSYWDSTDQTLFSDGSTQGIGPSYTLSLSQTVEIAGQRGKRIEMAQHNDAVASANIDAARLSLVNRVERAFNETLEAHARTQIAYELLHWQRELHKAYRNASETERNDSQIRISRAQSEHASEQHALFIQESRLR